MSTPLTGISSMATRGLLADLSAAYTAATGRAVAIEAVGGVDATQRVQAGEAFDVVVLAADTIDKLIAAGHLVAGSRVDLVRSQVAVAVRAGAPRPAIDSEAAVKAAVLAARNVAYSTGPSGVYIAGLFERWGIAAQLQGRVVQAAPGVPVGGLVADGQVELGFQQLSELMHIPGITVLGTLPQAIEVVTTFSAGRGAQSRRAAEVTALLDFFNSPAAVAIKRRHGQEPA
jgi:molybdate transport system substrate-binding protein